MEARPVNVPVFKLYGDRLEWTTPDLLHCESIPERSRLHDWEIKPHRHSDLVQLLYVRSGWAMIEIEGAQTRLEHPAIQVVPPMCIHGFHFSDRVEGYVITLAAPLAGLLDAQLDAPQPILATPGLYPIGEDLQYLDGLFEAINREYLYPAPARELQLHSLIGLVGTWLRRQAHDRQRQERPLPGQDYLQAFSALVEAHFREQLSIEQYAYRIGITPAHLNNVTRRFAGCTAQQVVHQRLLLEAKRQLIYTALSAKQIAEGLGFSEAAYFSRFFKRLMGLSPQTFRNQDRAGPSPSDSGGL
ncbi:AraC family transcriptional regulator [Stutzerimonas stutzeri]|uniref:AraC family transcriptional regulator n=1 Tax=Stutzerimonas stutzeri TaxID=316 RepID=W8QZY9_STUST|nr:helix-turn-helix domain-containing protein [Stutzerimonas stutzeri]AHL75924.1 AraC family transcriptional regulator [Stutzerimonas stutzeri]MCQ4330729.1 helix-turn-helix domain-containing protein [Stutzerimonas stutzeri]